MALRRRNAQTVRNGACSQTMLHRLRTFNILKDIKTTSLQCIGLKVTAIFLNRLILPISAIVLGKSTYLMDEK